MAEESSDSNGSAELYGVASSTQSSDTFEDMSKAIVFFQRNRGECHPHKFTPTSTYRSEDLLGSGAYGDVYRVKCLRCHKEYARKVIRFASTIQKAVRDKHIKDTDLELRCYMTLDHPHVLEYVHHELSETKMQIYTAYCQFGDLDTVLQELGKPGRHDFTWQILEGLVSALARCHSGLKASRKDGLVHEYTEFEPGWQTILHRDIKPGNVLLASRQVSDISSSSEERGGLFVTKLGDFGTSFMLEKGGKSPSTYRVGTRTFWAPEIVREEAIKGCRVTKWSAKSDIWGVGAVLHCILAGCVPLPDQPEELDDRTSQLKTKLWPELVDCSKLLLQIVSECLDPREDGRYRPTALQLLAVAIKSDTSPEGLQRSESFWQVMLTGAKAEDASAVVKHFITHHLPLLAKEKTVFSPKEIILITAMVFKHCSHLLSTAHNQLCQTFSDDPLGGTAFHALAHLDFDDEGTINIRLEHLKWPLAREMLSMALRKNKSGLLPSNLAALAGKIPLCKRLTEIEDTARALTSPLKSLREQLKTQFSEEFETMCQMLTYDKDQFNLPTEHASTVMIEMSEKGYSHIVRKLVELGVDPNVRGRRKQTPLHIFAYHGDDSMTRFLLSHNVLVDARDKHNRTPLHWAAWAGQVDAILALLSKRADVNAMDFEGRTALYGAAGGCYVEVVRLLLSHNADRSIRGGRENETPLERARKKHNSQLIDLLSD